MKKFSNNHNTKVGFNQSEMKHGFILSMIEIRQIEDEISRKLKIVLTKAFHEVKTVPANVARC